MNSLAIFSCYYGPDKDLTFKAQRYSGVTSYFITNNRKVADLASNLDWLVIFHDLPISESAVENALNAKYVKCMPHRFAELKNFKYLIYQDDKKVISPDLVFKSGLDSLKNGGALAIREHPSLKRNVWCEFGYAMLQERYREGRKELYTYIQNKLDNGFKEDGDLFWTSIIFRDMSHPQINEIGEAWYNEVLKCGIECQISFFFVAQKFDSIRILRIPDSPTPLWLKVFRSVRLLLKKRLIVK